jgi:NADP-dependent 3-hydroxy acid dehydrogenase YdfG
MAQNKLTGTVAIVTGASSGIGAATAKELAGLGATVAVIARREDRLTSLVTEIESEGGAALAVPADITDRAQAQGAVQTVIGRLGRLDILVNNAGLMLLGTVAEQEVEEWERMIAVNQNGLLFMTKAVLPHLLVAAEDELRGVADIVNIATIAGRQAGLAELRGLQHDEVRRERFHRGAASGGHEEAGAGRRPRAWRGRDRADLA